jgi:hypothetical protein
MIRTQVQLTTDQVKNLRQLSVTTGRSMADLVREGVDQLLASKGGNAPADRLERLQRVMGRFSSGCTDISQRHDRYLAEIYRS